MLKSIYNLSSAIKAKDYNRFKKIYNALWRTKPKVENVTDAKLQTKNVPNGCADEVTGDRLLHQAAALGQSQMVKVLLQIKEININIQNHSEETPLMQAYRNGHFEVINLLEKKGAKLPSNAFRLEHLKKHRNDPKHRVLFDMGGMSDVIDVLISEANGLIPNPMDEEIMVKRKFCTTPITEYQPPVVVFQFPVLPYKSILDIQPREALPPFEPLKCKI